MDWLSENWVWVLVAIAFFALHIFGHGGHGGHGGHSTRSEGRRLDRKSGQDSAEGRDEDAPIDHRH